MLRREGLALLKVGGVVALIVGRRRAAGGPMSEVVRIRGAEVARLGHDRAAISGTLGQVGAVLAEMRRAGPLVASDPVPDGRPGHVIVTVRLLPAATRVRVRRRFWTRRRAAVAAAAGLAVLGLAAWAVYLLVAWVVAHLAAVLAVLVLAGLAVGAFGPRVCKTVVTVVHRH
jgi:hypothetical protein